MDGNGGDGAAGGMDERVGGVVAGGQVDENPVQATPAAVAVVGKAHGIIRQAVVANWGYHRLIYGLRLECATAARGAGSMPRLWIIGRGECRTATVQDRKPATATRRRLLSGST